MACLATRIPYGTMINEETLKTIDDAEDYILSFGVSTVRVRHHGDMARIELLPDDLNRMLSESTRQDIASHLKSLGFKYVAIDLDGYNSGSMNRTLKDDDNGNA